MPTKRQLGIGYLAGVGVSLSLSLLAYVAYSHESLLVITISAFIAIALFGTIVYLGYLFLEISLPEDFVWSVAEWTAVGFGVAALVSFTIGFSEQYFPDAVLVPSLLVITIATGGLIGTLLGVITGLREQHLRMRELTQRNTVMNRVLRHNIRNDMNIIDGNASLLRESVNGNEEPLDAIQRTTDDVIRLSEAAKHIDELTTDSNRTPINATRVLDAVVDTTREKFPMATIDAELQDDIWVAASPLLRFVLLNLVENAIEHNDTDPRVHVSMTMDGEDDDTVEISVADNGPGIPPSERRILFEEREEELQHGNGLGLWLVKWFVDHFDGDLTFETRDPHGSIVHLTLPAAELDETDPAPMKGLAGVIAGTAA